jgi:hypothetical protein
MNIFVKGSSGTGTGIHIGGGCGGFYGEAATQLLSNIGLLIDTSITGTGNNQIFMGTSTWDTNTTSGVTLNDSVSVSPIWMGQACWIATSITGLTVTAWGGGRVLTEACTIYNNSGDGIKFAVSLPVVIIGDSTLIDSNAGYGINSTTGITINCKAKLVGLFNGTPYNTSTVTLVAQVDGPFAINENPTLGVALDGSNNSVSIASGSSAALAGGSGIILVSNPNNGDTAIYVAGGGVVKLVVATGTSWVAPTSSPGTGQVSITFDAVAVRYTIYSNFGSTQAYLVTIIRSRLSV